MLSGNLIHGLLAGQWDLLKMVVSETREVEHGNIMA